MDYRFAGNLASRQDRAAAASQALLLFQGLPTTPARFELLLVEFRINNSCVRSGTGFNLKEIVA